MAGDRISNTFSGGMQSDVDSRLNDNNTYKLAVNGRLIYNDQGSLAFENARGNILSISEYTSQYTTIGFCEFPEFVIVFSKYKKGKVEYDEIGYIRFLSNGQGFYNTLHNDTLDTLNQKLNFNTDFVIQSVPFYESDQLIRVYFTDDYNEPRVFTFKKIPAVNLLLQRVTTTEFTMNITPEFKMGEIHHQGIIKGSLRSGIYQYSYRLRTKDGYQTPFVPVTFPIPLTGIAPDTSDNTSQEHYGMANVDEQGVTGIRFFIRDVDTRYDEIEIAYIHAITDTSAKEAGIFYKRDISEVVNANNDIDVSHTTIENIIPLDNLDQLIDLKDVIVKAKTLQIFDNRLWFGNTETRSTINIPDDVLTNFYVEPEFRALPIDVGSADKIYKHQQDGFRPLHVEPGNFTSFKRKYQKYGSSDTYAVNTFNQLSPEMGDYYNYQGSLINAEWKGYFRSETYRFAVVFYDKKGYPFFAKHLADVSMPHHTRQWNRSGSDVNLLIAKRIKDDGSVDYREREIGALGGIPTDINYFFTDSANTDKRLIVTNSDINRSPSLPPIEDQYHIDNNSPTKVGIRSFRATRCIWSNPNYNNALGTLPELNTNTWYNTSRYKNTFSRILGVRFGGIDLNVVIDDKGTKLKDVVGGIQIVRAERTGANEQVKDQGLLINMFDKRDENYTPGAYDVKRRPMLFTHSSPVMSGVAPFSAPDYLTVPRFKTLFRDDGGGANGHNSPKENYFSFFGVNGLVAGDWASYKVGITKIRQEFICNPTNIRNSYGTHFEYMSLQDDYSSTTGPKTPRSYISKLLHTLNERALYTPSEAYPQRWLACGINTYDVKGIQKHLTPRSNYYLGGMLIYTDAWLARVNDESKTRGWESLALFTDNNYDGGGLGKSPDDKKWWRGAQAPSYLIECDLPLACAFGETASYSQHLSAYVVSLIEPNPEPYGGLKNEALQNTRFYTTGHFLKIDDDVLDDIAGNNYTLNELEVWGGDCVLDAFSFAKILPVIEYDEGCQPQALGSDAAGSEVGEPGANTAKEFRDWSHGVIVPVESKYNYRLTYKDYANGVPTWAQVGFANATGLQALTSSNFYREKTNNGLYASTSDTCGKRLENFQIQKALSYTEKIRAFFTKPFDYIEISDFPTRWHWSNLKQPHNQKVDVMRQFEELSNFDLDANYGEVTGNALLKNYFYTTQLKAFGRLRINERALATTDIGDIQLGEGGTMDGADYISYEYGSQHRDSIISTNKSIFFVDALKEKILRFASDGLSLISDTKGIHSFIQPYLENVKGVEKIITDRGIVSSFDYENNDVYFTIKRKHSGNVNEYQSVGGKMDDPNGYLTLMYNEDLQLFHSLLTAYPTMYFRNGNNFYSNNNNGTGGIYRYNAGNRGQFFDEYYYSYVDLSLNYQPRLAKKFDTSIWNINEEAISNIKRVDFIASSILHRYNDLSSELTNVNGFKTGVNTNRVKYRGGLLRFPIRERDSSKQRLTGKTADLEFWYDNSTNKKLSISNIDTVVRYHSRK